MRASLFYLVTVFALTGSQAAIADSFPQVRIETTAGDFVVELDADRSPISVQNFLHYVESGFYEGTIFHRVVADFVIQGGGYTADLKDKPASDAIPNESGNGLSNRRMTIAMARTGTPHSADSQFYINLAENTPLDPKPTRWGYAVFGTVIEGMDTIDDISYRPLSPEGSFEHLPAVPVIIEKAVVVSQPAE
jgi:cyclophilin family peptidyl-prolyl cis-trans isomerase